MTAMIHEYRVAVDGFGRFHVEVLVTYPADRDFISPGYFIGGKSVQIGFWSTLRTTRSRRRALRWADKYRECWVRQRDEDRRAVERTVVR